MFRILIWFIVAYLVKYFIKNVSLEYLMSYTKKIKPHLVAKARPRCMDLKGKEKHKDETPPNSFLWELAFLASQHFGQMQTTMSAWDKRKHVT